MRIRDGVFSLEAAIRSHIGHFDEMSPSTTAAPTRRRRFCGLRRPSSAPGSACSITCRRSSARQRRARGSAPDPRTVSLITTTSRSAAPAFSVTPRSSMTTMSRWATPPADSWPTSAPARGQQRDRLLLGTQHRGRRQGRAGHPAPRAVLRLGGYRHLPGPPGYLFRPRPALRGAQARGPAPALPLDRLLAPKIPQTAVRLQELRSLPEPAEPVRQAAERARGGPLGHRARRARSAVRPVARLLDRMVELGFRCPSVTASSPPPPALARHYSGVSLERAMAAITSFARSCGRLQRPFQQGPTPRRRSSLQRSKLLVPQV